MLEVIGPINLTDFNKIVTAENLYQVTQNEVEEKFFPGSIKKASFLTSLTRNLITELKNLKSDKYYLLFNKIYENLEGRHVQIYLHDLNATEAISELGYTGEIDMSSSCGKRCFSDKYSLVDANLGVNKSNYYIKRSQDVIIKVNKENISHELFVTYQNSVGAYIGESGIYKNYARVLLPKEAKVFGVRLYKLDGTQEDISYDLIDVDDRRELGFYFEILPETISRVQIVWNIKTDVFDQGGEYKLWVRKQAGTNKDPLSLKLFSDNLSLTGKVNPVYNTDLSRDYRTKLFFRPQ